MNLTKKQLLLVIVVTLLVGISLVSTVYAFKNKQPIKHPNPSILPLVLPLVPSML